MKIFLILVLVCCTLAQMQLSHLNADGASVRICIQNPSGTPKADIFYLHGFADRCDNHGPLFTEWTNKGFRVVSFDYPSHGETTGENIDLYPFTRLISLASQVERETFQSERPFILAGWSTGGLVAVREVQAIGGFKRRISGLILFTPGVSVHTLIGENGFVTVRTLTSNPNPPYRGPPKPDTPLKHPLFAGFILANAHESRKDPMPKIPTLVIVADDDKDRYVKSRDLLIWIQNQRDRGVNIDAIQCPGSLHDTDNEREPIGQTVRSLAATYAQRIVGSVTFNVTKSQDPCKRV